MSRCEHALSSGTAIVWHDADGHLTFCTFRPRHHLKCITCKEAFSLGPANDSPEALVELRAAEIVANGGPIRTCRNSGHDDCEECGWDTWPWVEPTTPSEEAGWLARAIVEHDTHADEDGDRR